MNTYDTKKLCKLSAAFLVVMLFLLTTLTGQVEASTSAGAKIFNEVTVTYTFNAITTTAKADATVTVVTLAAAPTVSVDTTAQTTLESGEVIYTYTVRSNANGIDTYVVTPNPPTSTQSADLSAPTNVMSSYSIDLWGGIVTGSAAGVIQLPGGFDTTNLVATTSKVALLVDILGTPTLSYYTVTAFNAGTGQTATAAESNGTMTLTPIGGSPAITNANVVVGTQVGEYINNLTLTQDAGSLTSPTTTGTHTTNLTFTTTATDLAGPTTLFTTTSLVGGNQVVTTVLKNVVTITKVADKANAKPGETITYTITVTNVHPTLSISNVYISDPVPEYTTLVTGNTVTVEYPIGTTTTYTTANDGDQAEFVGGTNLVVTFGQGVGLDAGVPTGGTLPATVDNVDDRAIITFQVTVQ